MKIAVLGFGVVGSSVCQIIDALNGDLEVKRILVKEGSKISDERMVDDYELILNDGEIEVICECIGGLEPSHTYLVEAIKHHKHVVTSNKKMLATYAIELFNLAKEYNVSLGYEATSGGGICWIHELSKIKELDTIYRFRGIFNGTTNYILSLIG